ncbi:ER protein Pkr1-domain-containing protein [Diplogelasinospora grovesii]|uniref:ER protein Pkr1-domain-containing protein n=1 Tax=Diplogelasinospora grovesii TaxID=303347 RepID=A0AAN6S437_9PEZI|nr:ER protein Pkr1-domain-containing protein [Diplogelasinospora grovesii]
MASFIENLWESIFTPGPTPTLLIATNVTFATLQVLLAAMLYATYSVHFLVLSVLCAGLWGSINWFAGELKQHQLQEEEKVRRAQAAKGKPAITSDDSETEVEGAKTTKASGSGSKQRGRPAPPKPAAVSEPATVIKAEAEPVEEHGELKQRAAAVAAVAAAAETPITTTLAEDYSPSQGGSKSSVSTEDEWEKVSEDENGKDK